MVRVLRLVLLCFALPIASFLAIVGFFAKPRPRDEEEQADAGAVLSTEEELEDASLEESDDDWLRKWLADMSLTQRGRRIRRAYSYKRFVPNVPWVRSKPKRG